MANINAPPIDYFNSFANEIMSKFRRMAPLIKHSLSSGEYHEEVVRNVIRNFISKRFSVKTGFIFWEGRSSRQLDIMIIDENNPVSYLFQEGDFAIVIPDAVVAVIEVKSLLNKKSFLEGIENIASVKELYEYPGRIASIIFGYDSGNIADLVLNNWFKDKSCQKYKDRHHLMPDSILFFKRGSLLLPFNNSIHENLSPNPGVYNRLHAKQHKGSLLSIILAQLINALNTKQMNMTHQFPTIQAEHIIQDEGVIEDDIVFEIGIGIIENKSITHSSQS